MRRDLFEQPAAEGGNTMPANFTEDGSDKPDEVVAANDAGDGYVLRAENAGGGYTITDLFTNAGVTGQQNLSASIKGHKWVKSLECLSGGLVFSGAVIGGDGGGWAGWGCESARARCMSGWGPMFMSVF